MALLRLGHSADLSGGTAPSQHIELAPIDPRRAKFAGMIDAQHARDLRRR